MAASTKSANQLLPPYISWKTFENYVSSLKNTTVPHTLDNTARPASMSGGSWRQLVVAIRFAGLTDQNNQVQDSFESLVMAHGTDQWGSALKEHVLPAYDRIIGDLPIEKATIGQLQKKFAEEDLSGSMAKRCISFYLHALKSAGVKFSSLLSMRDDSSNGNSPRKRKPRTVKSRADEVPNENGTGSDLKTPQGMIDFPIPFGTSSGMIRVPRGITIDQYPMVQAIVQAVEALAKQNSPKGK